MSKEHFDTKTIFISYSYQKLQQFNLKLPDHFENKLLRFGQAKLLILYTNLLKILGTIGLKHNFLLLID